MQVIFHMLYDWFAFFFFLTIVMTNEACDLNNEIFEKKADKSPVAVIRWVCEAELCVMLPQWLSSSTCGAVADSKQKAYELNKQAHTPVNDLTNAPSGKLN